MIGLYHKSPIPKKKSSKDWASVHASVCCTKELLGIWIYETKLLSFPSGKKNNQYSSPQHWINIFYSHLIKTTSRNYQGLDLSQANKLMVFHLGLHYSTVIPLLKIHTLSNRTKGGGMNMKNCVTQREGAPKENKPKQKDKKQDPHINLGNLPQSSRLLYHTVRYFNQIRLSTQILKHCFTSCTAVEEISYPNYITGLF